MINLYVDYKNINNNIIEIDDKNDINYILNVHRLKLNDNIRVVDNTFEYLTEIIEISKKRLILKIIEKNEDTYSLDVKIDVAVSILKNDSMNFLIQKLTEIGVNKIIPMITEYTVVKIDKKKDKWDKIITETMKQCKAVKKTKIDNITKLKDINFKEYDKCIFVYEKSTEINKITNIINKNDKKILILIGAEGGFSIEEKNFLEDKTYQMKLGKRILRAETATIYVVSVISYIF